MAKQTKHIKKFKEHQYNVAVKQLEKKRDEIILLHQMYDIHFGCDTHTIEGLNILLKEKTGFDNPVMSADSLGKKTAYDTIVMMNASVNIDVYNQEDATIKSSFLKELRESYTTYYTEEEYDYLQKVRKVVDGMNSINKYDSMSIQFSNIERKFVYRSELANSYKSFART
jgi:hypothetical protein